MRPLELSYTGLTYAPFAIKIYNYYTLALNSEGHLFRVLGIGYKHPTQMQFDKKGFVVVELEE